MVTSSQELLQEAIEAAKAKRPAEALRILKEVVLLEPRNETAWLWLSRLLESDKQRIVCLRNVLVINPDNEAAREELNILKERAATMEPVREGAEEPAALVVPGTAAPGVASERPAAEAREATPAIQPWPVDAEDKARVDTDGQRKGSGCALFVLGGVGGVFLLLLGFLLAWALGIIELPGGAPPLGPIYEAIEEATRTPLESPTQEPTATTSPSSLNLAYLECMAPIYEEASGLWLEIPPALETHDWGGSAYSLCSNIRSWEGKTSSFNIDHMRCSEPADPRLQYRRQLVIDMLTALQLEVQYLSEWCVWPTESNTRPLGLAAAASRAVEDAFMEYAADMISD